MFNYLKEIEVCIHETKTECNFKTNKQTSKYSKNKQKWLLEIHNMIAQIKKSVEVLEYKVEVISWKDYDIENMKEKQRKLEDKLRHGTKRRKEEDRRVENKDGEDHQENNARK